MLDLAKEKSLFSQGYRIIAGVDEAGRGPLCGPVVAAAVALGEDFVITPDLEKVADSKKLSAKRREQLFAHIKEHALAVEISVVSNLVIDRINILQASFLAMKNAVAKLSMQPDFVLVDGHMKIPKFDLAQEAIIDGDAQIFAIAAASIIAKVSRDYLMTEFDKEYPQYGFAKHKGYGTKAHLEALTEYGPCPIHRASFAPVAKCLKVLKKNPMSV